MDYIATEPGHNEQDVVILIEKDQELIQNTDEVEREAQSMLESFVFSSGPSTEENLVETHVTHMSDTETPFSTASTADPPQPFDKALPSKEMSNGSQHSTAPMTSIINSTETSDSPWFPTSFVPTHYNETNTSQDSQHILNQSNAQSTTGPSETNDTYAHNLTQTDKIPKHNTQPSEMAEQIQDSIFDFNTTRAIYVQYNHTQEENMLEVTHSPTDSIEEELVHQLAFSTKSSQVEGEILQSNKATRSPGELTTMWIPLDGSGDLSQGINSATS